MYVPPGTTLATRKLQLMLAAILLVWWPVIDSRPWCALSNFHIFVVLHFFFSYLE